MPAQSEISDTARNEATSKLSRAFITKADYPGTMRQGTALEAYDEPSSLVSNMMSPVHSVSCKYKV